MVRILCITGAAALVASTGAAALDLTLERAVEMAIAGHRSVETAQRSVQGEALSLSTAKSAFDLRVVPTGTVGRIGSNAFTTAEGINSSVGVQVSKRFETGTVLALGPSYNRSGADRNTTLALSLQQPLVRGWSSAISLDPANRAQFSYAPSHRPFEQPRLNPPLQPIRPRYRPPRHPRPPAV